MGFKSFIKQVIYGHDDEAADEAALRAAREKHGIKTDVEEEGKKTSVEEEEYDPWEDIRNMRMHFFFGTWVTRKFRVVGEEKVKKQLADLEKKREEEAKRKAEKEGEGGV
jgi:ADP-ribose pyrophosphatase YjhB (NUDIX family)